jgi:Trp operon repressor
MPLFVVQSGLGAHSRTYEALDEPTRRARDRIVVSITAITRRSGNIKTAQARSLPRIEYDARQEKKTT